MFKAIVYDGSDMEGILQLELAKDIPAILMGSTHIVCSSFSRIECNTQNAAGVDFYAFIISGSQAI